MMLRSQVNKTVDSAKAAVDGTTLATAYSRPCVLMSASRDIVACVCRLPPLPLTSVLLDSWILAA